MNADKENELTIRRILVALDTSAHSQAALHAAATLAALLKAELVGLFVEDINLIRLARLPFVREVRYLTATPQELNPSQMEGQLKRMAAQAKRELSYTAEEYDISWSFRVVRGPVPAAVLAATLEADLLAMGRISHAPVKTTRLGSTAKTAVSQAPRPVLLMCPDADLERPALVIFDGSGTAWRALRVAALLAQSSGTLRIFIWASDDGTAQQYKNDIARHFEKSNVEISYRRLYRTNDERLTEIIHNSDVGLLVLGNTDTQLPPEMVETLLHELDYPILIVR